MAKIPRIEQGDRPSGVPAVAPVNTASAAMIGSVGGVSESLMNVATDAELRERRRLAEAMDAKQKIVDASDTGRLTTQFESQLFKVEDDLHKEFADNPAAALDAGLKRAREVSPQIADRGPNDFVKLAVTQGNESSISSFVGRLHSWIGSRQTERVKGNLSADINEAAAGAINFSSAAQVGGYADRITTKLAPMFEMTYGADAAKEIGKMRSAIARRYSANGAKKFSLQLIHEIENDPFLKRSLDENEQTMFSEDAYRGYKGMRDTSEFNLAREAFDNGEKLAGLVGADGFVDAAADKVNSLTEQKKKIAVDTNLEPSARKVQIAAIDEHLKTIEALKNTAYRQKGITAVDDPKTKETLWQYQTELFGDKKLGVKTKKSAKGNLDLLLAQQVRLIKARDEGTLTPGTFDAYFDDVSFARKAEVARNEGEKSWTFKTDARGVGTAILDEKFKKELKRIPPDQQLDVRLEFLKRLQAAQKQGGGVTKAHARQMALDSLSMETGTIMPGTFEGGY